MENLPLTLFDVAFLFAILVFGTLAFLKGFVKEIFSLFNWIAAIMLTFITFPLVTKFLADTPYPAMFVESVAKIILFIVFVIIISIFTSKISKPLSERVPMSVNQPLGLAFGSAKAYLIAAVVFTVMTTVYSYDAFLTEETIAKRKEAEKLGDYRVGPNWLKDSISYDFLAAGSSFLQPFVDFAIASTKEGALKGKNSMSGRMAKKIDQINKIKEGDLGDESEASNKQEKYIKDYYKEEGYDIDQIYRMKNLVDSVSGVVNE